MNGTASPEATDRTPNAEFFCAHACATCLACSGMTGDALATIASRANGSVRDALSILEQCAAAGDKELNRAAVLEYTGAAGEDFFLALTGAVIDGDAGKALVYIDEIIRRGKDPRQIMKDWLKHMRDLMIVKYVGKAERIVGSSGENISRLRAQADLTDAVFIEKAIRLISEYINLGRYSERPRILLETAAVRLASPDDTAEAPARRPLRPAPKREAAPVRAAEAPARAAAPAEEESAADALAGMIASVQREEPGRPEDMWDRIVRAVSAQDRTFMSLVGRYSTGVEFDAGRLSVIVSPGKLRLAEDKSSDIAQAAKSIYGSDVYVTMKAGVISKSGAAEDSAGSSEEETARIINEDINKNEVIGDILDLFGIEPVIED